MTIVLIRAVILYIVIICAVRFMGKRQIGELQPSELVITILVSNIATLPIEDPSIPMIMGILPIFTLACLDVLMSGATLKWRRLRRFVSGSPKIIIWDGEIDQQQLLLLRFSLDDVMEALRENGVFDLADVQFAIVETTGKISVYEKPSESNGQKAQDPPAIVINDGEIVEDALRQTGMKQEALDKLLKEQSCSPKDVFLLSVGPDGTHLVKKQKKKKKSPQSS